MNVYGILLLVHNNDVIMTEGTTYHRNASFFIPWKSKVINNLATTAFATSVLRSAVLQQKRVVIDALMELPIWLMGVYFRANIDDYFRRSRQWLLTGLVDWLRLLGLFRTFLDDFFAVSLLQFPCELMYAFFLCLYDLIVEWSVC